MDLPYIVLTEYEEFVGLEAKRRNDTKVKLVRWDKEDLSQYLELQLLLVDSIVVVRLFFSNLLINLTKEDIDRERKRLDGIYTEAKERGYLDGKVIR